jgi:cohesin loading factor subunit SCC2
VTVSLVSVQADSEINSCFLSHLVSVESASRKSKTLKTSPLFANSLLSAIAQSAIASYQHLSTLNSRPDLSFSDSLVIQTVYLATAPLFVTEISAARKTGAKDKAGKEGGVMKSLRMEALACLRGVSSTTSRLMTGFRQIQ